MMVTSPDKPRVASVKLSAGEFNVVHPSTSRDETSSSSWDMVLEAFTELRGEVAKLKLERRMEVPIASTSASHGCTEPEAEVSNPQYGESLHTKPSESTGSFSGFSSVDSDENGEAGEVNDEVSLGYVLLQAARSFGSLGEVLDDVDMDFKDMVKNQR